MKQHCLECIADIDCALTGYPACVNGKCEKCNNDSYCSSNPFQKRCSPKELTCRQCLSNRDCEIVNPNLICNMGNGTCQEHCPVNHADVVCSNATQGCECGVGYTCQNNLCRPAGLFCFHNSTIVMNSNNIKVPIS